MGRNRYGSVQSIDVRYRLLEEHLTDDEFDKYLEDAGKRDAGRGEEVDDDSGTQEAPEDEGGASEVD